MWQLFYGNLLKYLSLSVVASKNNGTISSWRLHIFSFIKSYILYRGSLPEVLLGKGGLKICSKFTEEHPFRSAVSIKLQSNFVEITLRHERSLVNLLHTFRALFYKNTSGWLLLFVAVNINNSDICISLDFIHWTCLNFFILKMTKSNTGKKMVNLNENLITKFFLKQQNIILLLLFSTHKKVHLKWERTFRWEIWYCLYFRTYYLQQLIQQLWTRKKVSTNK